ncbi:hypothetical protein [Micromonospora endophytica]|uniref:hypothetical protein n=1 Tax=Micromonospora endophytica TaxID=515350 RepID=UPI001CB8F2A9|nr:hypothetical protein [Micromonospora endophytica]
MNDEASGRARPWWRVLRLAVVGLWLVTASVAWWTAPREQSYEQARADLAAGRVTAYEWGYHWDVDVRPAWFPNPTMASAGTLGPLFQWRTPDGRVWWTDTTRFDQVEVTGTVEKSDYSGPGAVGVAQEIRSAGLEDRYGEIRPYSTVLTAAGLVFTVVFLGVVVAGPAPVLGTRWFWFWLVSGVPYGLGLLFWLAREHPWSGTAAATATTSGGPRERDRGLLGFAIGAVAAILLSLVSLALHEVLGDRWIPLSNR